MYRFIRFLNKDITDSDKELFNTAANEYPSGSQENANIGLAHVGDTEFSAFVRTTEGALRDQEYDGGKQVYYVVSDATPAMDEQFDRMQVSMNLSKLHDSGEDVPEGMDDIDMDFVTQWSQDFLDLLPPIPGSKERTLVL